MVRKTRQREIIRSVFREAGRPLSAREAIELARARFQQIGTATVYRTINGFVENGWLIPVEIPAEPTRYEISGQHHHHHFYCRACQKVFDVNGCPENFQRISPPGFVLEAHEVILYGRCAKCSGNGRGSS